VKIRVIRGKKPFGSGLSRLGLRTDDLGLPQPHGRLVPRAAVEGVGGQGVQQAQPVGVAIQGAKGAATDEADERSRPESHHLAPQLIAAHRQALLGETLHVGMQRQRGEFVPLAQPMIEHQPRQRKGQVLPLGTKSGRREELQVQPGRGIRRSQQMLLGQILAARLPGPGR